MRFNARGQAALGVGDGTVSVDGTAISQGGGIGWIDDDRLLFQRSPDYRLCVYNQCDLTITQVSERGANELAAGGGRWGAWLAGYGAYASTGDVLPDAGLLDVGPDGTFAYVPSRQAGVGYRLVAADGRTAGDDGVVVRDFRCYRDLYAYWVGPDGSLRTNTDVPVLVISGERMYRPVVVQLASGAYWVVYATTVPDIRARPVDSPFGVVVQSGVCYNHDAVVLADGTVKVGWSTGQGERPDELKTLTVNPATAQLPLVDFRQAADLPAHVTPFDRPLWLACFKDDAGAAPGNAVIHDVLGLIRRRDGAVIATPIENLDIQGCQWKTPNGGIWRSVELYLGGFGSGSGYLNPPATAAEAYHQVLVLAQQVIGPLSPETPVLIIVQCYDRNRAWLNEETLVGMQPAWAEVVRRYPQVVGILPFCWERDVAPYGGITHHPRLRPWIDAYAAAILGEPTL